MATPTAPANGNTVNAAPASLPPSSPAPLFAATFFHQVATQHPEENIIVSPLLLEATLALLFLGSDGETAQQLKNVLQLKRFGSNAKMANYYADVLDAFSKTQEETHLLMLHKLLLLSDSVATVSDEFQKIAHKYFHTSVETQLPATTKDAKAHLSDVLSKAALGKMSPTIAEQLLPALARVLHLSAVYFQNKWFLPFSGYRSGIYDFHLNAEQRRAVPMLFDDDMFVKFGEFKDLDARAIELPYEHEEDELAMLLLLPNQRDGLAALEQRLAECNLYDLDVRMQMESVQVLLPKFRIDFTVSLRETLEKLGLTSLFNNEANFTNLLKDAKETLPIGDLLHKVCMEVNESGSAPAAVVANKPIAISNCIDTRQKFFRADHPFYFAIRSRDLIYFAGHVTNF